MTEDKIFSVEGLIEIAGNLRRSGKRIILCHGTFDLMHAGHIRYLQRAKKEGDILFVTVTANDFVNKGPGRPVFGEVLRAENLAALECVDFVAINYSTTAVELLQKIKPEIYAKGGEYRNYADDITGNIAREISVVEEYGGKTFYTDEITFSSSNLLNEHFGVFSPETKEFLNTFSDLYKVNYLNKIVDSFKKLNVLVVGDAIIDQYHYVSTLGQTGKDNVLAVNYRSEEQFAGGALAVANHVSKFAGKVSLLTGLGSYHSHEDFIRDKLQPNITPRFEYFKDSPTVTKRRFVDGDLAKLFEVYFYEEDPILNGDSDILLTWLKEQIPQFDLIIAADFGNGFITKDIVEVLCLGPSFLAVNTQVNSGNRGYHVINKYKRADFISLNEPELRLSAHNRQDSLELLAKEATRRLDAQYFAVTRGTKGVLWFDQKNDEFCRVPALSSRVIDRIGAGDAFLSLASLCLAAGSNSHLASFIGSVAAAIDVQIVCNREPIDPISLKRYIGTLLK